MATLCRDLERMPKESYRTRKGVRFYRLGFTRGGVMRFCEDFTMRVKSSGRQYYFNLGPDKKKAGKLADEIKAFLGVRGNTLDDALRRYGDANKIYRLNGQGSLTVGKLIEGYKLVTSHLSRNTL